MAVFLAVLERAGVRGAFKDNKFNGQGTEMYADGSTYTGAFRDGKANGQGTYTSADGNNTYTGKWKDGKPVP